MKTLITLLFLLLLLTKLDAQRFSLVDVVTVSEEGVSPADVKLMSMGGELSFTVVYTSTCDTDYRLSWRFSKDIRTLNNGEKFDVTLQCISCQTSCGKRWTRANVGGSNNIFFSSIPNYDAEYNGNMRVVSSTAGSFGVNGWSSSNLTHTYTVQIEKRKEAQYTAFYITMGGHTIYFLYAEGATKTGPTNCHTLLGLGKLVNALEMGALNGYSSSWMLETVGYAIQHIQASNCLDDSYLLGLQKRLQTSSETHSFLNEIRNYSADLENEVASNCDCCSN